MSIYLSNYIGIYNAMGLYDIQIDLSQCQHKILVIRGDNGGGKSTLMNAISLFPDNNDSFIKGVEARKEIVLLDNNVLYKLSFIHSIKSNGERDTTKAYISKIVDGYELQLNENGNISSYKDILYSELGLDPNFMALSQLSNEDRGLADKRPAERKRFVNSIISSLDVYNNIYKTLSKLSSSCKGMINSISAKIAILGDEAILKENLEKIENEINENQNQKDAAIADLALQQSTISLLDPDNSIQNLNTTVVTELNEIESQLDSYKDIVKNIIKNLPFFAISDNNSIQDEYNKYLKLKNELSIQNQIDRNTLESTIATKESSLVTLNEKIQKMNSLKVYNINELNSYLQECEEKISEIKNTMRGIGVEDIDGINREEYIIALETFKDIMEIINIFKQNANYEIIEKIKLRLQYGEIPELILYDHIEKNIVEVEETIEILKNTINNISGKMYLLDALKIRPKSCKNNNCGFIKEAMEFNATNPEQILANSQKELNENIELLKHLYKELNDAQKYNDAINQISIILRSIDKNGSVLFKIASGRIFQNKIEFLNKLMNGYDFDYIQDIYKYIDLANLIDIYKQTMKLYNQYLADKNIYESREVIIDDLIKDIEMLRESMTDLSSKIEIVTKEIFDNEKKIKEIQDIISKFETLFKNMEIIQNLDTRKASCQSQLLENSRKMNEINLALNKMDESKKRIEVCNNILVPLMKERDQLQHSVRMREDYMNEKNALDSQYEFVETLRKYSSPTTGIQLVFMELYMGNIINLANNLLSLLFKGEFVIQPFIINETEFRIPCLGSGYLNDDISSMSSSQIGMISMILSFALLNQSSTKYNVIKLDEIDGPLDYNNRLYFMDVLFKIMDIMGTEQCILISHNTELQLDNCDVICLKHDRNNSDYQRGNIIWSY